METASGHICEGLLGLETQTETGVSAQAERWVFTSLLPGYGHRVSGLFHALCSVSSAMMDYTLGLFFLAWFFGHRNQ